MECTKYHKMISAYIDDETPSLEVQALERHMSVCPSCRAELAKAIALKDMLKSSFAPTIEIDMSKNIMAMIKKQKKPVVKTISMYKKISVIVAAAAALIVIGLAAFFTMGNEETLVAGNEKLEEYVIEHVGAENTNFHGRLAAVNLEK